MASVVAPGSNGDGLTASMMSRPQIGIERLQVRRPSNEPKEAMNCKSCRKRKVGDFASCQVVAFLCRSKRLIREGRSNATASSQPARLVRLSTARVFMVGLLKGWTN